jgi:hypothetical protein
MQKTNHPIEPAEMMAYLDGELPIHRAAAAAAHLERCSECQALAADMRAVSQSLLSWQVESSSAAAPAVPAVSRGSWRDRLRLRPWAWGLVTAGVLMLLVSSPLVHQRMGSPVGLALSEQARPEPSPAAQDTFLPGAPMVARTAALNLATREFDRARAAIDAVIQRHHGYLGSLNITAPAGEPRSLTATLRVPADELAAALDELKKLGRVESEQQSGEEVGEQYVDLEARLSNARHTEERLTAILRDRTGKLADVLDVEKELDRVRGEIERMDGEKKALLKRVDFATVNLTLSEAGAGAASNRVGSAAAEGWRNMVASLVAVTRFVAATGPTVLVWALLLFFPVRYAWKRWRSQLS